MAIHAESAALSPGELRPYASTRRRGIEAVAFVVVWVAAGYLLPIGANGYLLLGIPLTVALQVLVRRRPLRELFAGNATRFTLDRQGLALAAALALVPGVYAVAASAAGDATLLGWYLAAVAGALVRRVRVARRLGAGRAALGRPAQAARVPVRGRVAPADRTASREPAWREWPDSRRPHPQIGQRRTR